MVLLPLRHWCFGLCNRPYAIRYSPYSRWVSELALQSFLTFLVVFDPIGLVPIFIALASHQPMLVQRRMARKAVLIAGVVIVLFALFGRALLFKLGISLEALKVAGGLLLFKIAVEMVFAQAERETKEEEEEARQSEDISVFPLAIPLIAGPGALASVLIQTGRVRDDLSAFGLVILMAALVLWLTYWCLRGSVWIAKALRRTGVNVISRVLGILLAALAVQYVADGVRVLLKM